MPIRGTYTHTELVEECTRVMCKIFNEDPESLAILATNILGPDIKWNPEAEEYEELE